MRGQTVRLDGLEPTVTDFAGSHIFLFILSLRGKAEFRAGQRSRTVPKQSELPGSAVDADLWLHLNRVGDSSKALRYCIITILLKVIHMSRENWIYRREHKESQRREMDRSRVKFQLFPSSGVAVS